MKGRDELCRPPPTHPHLHLLRRTRKSSELMFNKWLWSSRRTKTLIKNFSHNYFVAGTARKRRRRQGTPAKWIQLLMKTIGDKFRCLHSSTSSFSSRLLHPGQFNNHHHQRSLDMVGATWWGRQRGRRRRQRRRQIINCCGFVQFNQDFTRRQMCVCVVNLVYMCTFTVNKSISPTHPE